MKVYSTDRLLGPVSTTVLKDSPYRIMWTRGGFFVSPNLLLKKHLDTLEDYCLRFDKTVLLFSDPSGMIRADIFWTCSPGELFWKQCMDLSETEGPHQWASAIDTVYRNHKNDPGILVLGETQSRLYFST